METRTRTTLGIFAHFTDAWPLLRILEAAGLDAKIVSKHALQIHPDQAERAVDILRAHFSPDRQGTPQRP